MARRRHLRQHGPEVGRRIEDLHLGDRLAALGELLAAEGDDAIADSDGRKTRSGNEQSSPTRALGRQGGIQGLVDELDGNRAVANPLP